MGNKRFQLDKLLGVNADRELVFVDELFSWDGEKMQGATGYTMGVLTKEDIERCNEDVEEQVRDVWKEAVRCGETEKGLAEYAEECRENLEDDQLFVGDDPSFRYEANEAFDGLSDEMRAKVEEAIGRKGEDFEEFNSSSCGRCLAKEGEEWLVVVEPALLDLVNRCEKEGISVAECESALARIMNDRQEAPAL